MAYYREYKNFQIDLSGGEKKTASGQDHFFWKAIHFGKEIANGTSQFKAAAYQAACVACDDYLDQPYRFKINLVDFLKVETGDVVTKEGEFLGTWDVDENDHPSFTPDGATEPLFIIPFVGLLCRTIEEWRIAQLDGKNDI